MKNLHEVVFLVIDEFYAWLRNTVINSKEEKKLLGLSGWYESPQGTSIITYYHTKENL